MIKNFRDYFEINRARHGRIGYQKRNDRDY